MQAICLRLSAWINGLIVFCCKRRWYTHAKDILFDDWRKASVFEYCYITPRSCKYTMYALVFWGVDQEEEKVGGNLTSETHIIIIKLIHMWINQMQAVYVLLSTRYRKNTITYLIKMMSMGMYEICCILVCHRLSN